MPGEMTANRHQVNIVRWLRLHYWQPHMQDEHDVYASAYVRVDL